MNRTESVNWREAKLRAKGATYGGRLAGWLARAIIMQYAEPAEEPDGRWVGGLEPGRTKGLRNEWKIPRTGDR